MRRRRGPRLTINQALSLALLFALLPVTAYSIWQGATLQARAQADMATRLAANARGAASVQNENIIVARQRLAQLARDPAVRSFGAGCPRVLATAVAGQRALVNIALSDASGQLRCSAVPATRAINFQADGWWRQARTAQAFTLSRPLTGPITGQNILIVALPLRDGDGDFVGVLSAGIRASWVRDSLYQSLLDPRGRALLVDGAGRVVIASAPGGPDRFALGRAGSTPRRTTDAAGTEWVYAASPLGIDDNAIVYAEPARTAMLIARQGWRGSIIVPLALIAVTLLTLWLALQFLVLRWLGELHRQIAAPGAATQESADFARAPTEIASLAADLDRMRGDIAVQTARLRKQAEEAMQLTREVHHRVRNNLQLILSLVSLQIQTINNDEARLALAQFRARTEALALIYRLIYEQDDRSEHGIVPADRLLGALCGQLQSLANDPTAAPLCCRAPAVSMPIDLATPLALIVVEAVSNAYRHGLADRSDGHIAVSLARTDAGWQLIVGDNGRGFVPDDESKTLGLQLVAIFARQLNGRYHLQSRPGGGTQLIVDFPDFAARRGALPTQ